MNDPIEIILPLNDETASSLNAGDEVLLTGPVYGARDAVHKKFVDLFLVVGMHSNNAPDSFLAAG